MANAITKINRRSNLRKRKIKRGKKKKKTWFEGKFETFEK